MQLLYNRVSFLSDDQHQLIGQHQHHLSVINSSISISISHQSGMIAAAMARLDEVVQLANGGRTRQVLEVAEQVLRLELEQPTVRVVVQRLCTPHTQNHRGITEWNRTDTEDRRCTGGFNCSLLLVVQAPTFALAGESLIRTCDVVSYSYNVV